MSKKSTNNRSRSESFQRRNRQIQRLEDRLVMTGSMDDGVAELPPHAARWTLDTLADQVAPAVGQLGPDGVIGGAVRETEGSRGGAAEFYGSTSKIDLGRDLRFAYSFEDSFTISAGVKIVDFNGRRPVVDSHRYGIEVNPDNTIRFWINDRHGRWRSAISDQPLELNQWTDVAGVYNGPNGLLQIYVDGRLAGQETSAGLSTYPYGRLLIGYSDHIGGFPFSGAIDDVRIYDEALSQEQIAAIPYAEDLVAEPVAITSVGVGSTSWSPEVAQHLAGVGLVGSDGFLDATAASDSPAAITLGAVDQFRVQFADSPEGLSEASLALTDGEGGFGRVLAFDFDAATNVATWTTTPVDGAKLWSAHLDGVPLATADGEPVRFDFASLPGDFNADGAIDAADFTVWRDQHGASWIDGYHLWRDGFNAVLDEAATPRTVRFVGSDPSDPGVPLLDASTVEDTPFTVELGPANDRRYVLIVAPTLGSAEIQGGQLSYTPGPDRTGVDRIVYRVERLTAGGAVEATLAVVAIAVTGENDPPVAVGNPQPVLLDADTPDREINLNDLFADADGDALSFEVVGGAATLASATVTGSVLRVEAAPDQRGFTSLSVVATDPSGATATVPLLVSFDTRTQLEAVQFAPTSDQVMAFGGRNTFVLQTNFDDSTRITVRTSNGAVLGEADVSIESLGGGRHRVRLVHGGGDYGLTMLQFEAAGQVFADVAVIVTPDASLTAEDVDFGDASISFRREVDENGVTVATSEFNDKYLAMQYRDGVVDPETLFAIVRPVAREATPWVHALEGSTVEAGGVSSAGFARSSTGSNPPSSTGGSSRSFVRVTTTSLADVKPGLLSPSDRSFADIYGDAIAGEVSDRYGASRLTNLVNWVDDLNPANWPSTLASWVGIEARSRAVAEFTVDPSAANKATLRQTLALTAAVEYVTGTFMSLKGLRETLTNPEVAKDTIRLATELAGHGITKYSDLYGIIVEMNGVSAQVDEITDSIHEWSVIQQTVEFTADVGEELLAIYNAGTDLAATTSDGELQAELEVYGRVLEGWEAQQELVVDAQTAFNEQIGQPPIDIDASDLPSGPTTPPAADEATGDNEVDQAAINAALDAAIEKHPTLTTAAGAGKQLFDLVRGGRDLFDAVADLFPEGDEGGYQDPGDSTTYYLNQRQVRDNGAGRDIINTGNKNDVVNAGPNEAGDDRISSLRGDDYLNGGDGRNTYFAGPGRDTIIDGNGASFISAGSGEDTISPGPGSDFIDAGADRDTIVFEGRDIGNNNLIDPSREGVLDFTGFAIEELTFRKDGNDLEIIAPSDGETSVNSVRYSGYFANDAAGWEVIDAAGTAYNLYHLTGRVTSYEAIRVTFAPRQGDVPDYPQGVTHVSSFTGDGGRFTVHVAEDHRTLGANSTLSDPGLVVTFEGDATLEGWLSRNTLASLADATALTTRLLSEFAADSYQRITVVGAGEGGLVAQWFASALATRGAELISTYLINTPDASGLISQVVRTELPEYSRGFRNLTNNFLVNPDDWVSRIGQWSGSGEIYGNWKAWGFTTSEQLDDSAPAPSYQSILEAHSPTVSEADFDDIDIGALELSHVQGIVSFTDQASMAGAMADETVTLSDGAYQSTRDAWNTLVDSATLDAEFDPIAGTQADRDAWVALLAPDALAADADDPFSVRLDLQGRSTSLDDLADRHLPLTEASLYVDTVTAFGKYGWESTEGVGNATDTGRASRLERDGVKVTDATLLVDINAPNAGPGTYNIAITVGDRDDIQESLQIFVDGYAVDRVSTMPGDFLTRTFQVSVDDPVLRIGLRDIGGQSDFFAINGITIEKVNYRDPLAASEIRVDDPSLVVLTQSYELPETTAALELLKATTKAAAMAVATAGVGAVMGASSSLTSIAAGLSKSTLAKAAGTTQSLLGSGPVTAGALKSAIIGSFQKTVPAAVLKGVASSVVTTAPQLYLSNPIAKYTAGLASSVFSQSIVSGEPLDFANALPFSNNPFKQGLDNLDRLAKVNKGISDLTKAVKLAGELANQPEDPGYNIPAPWVYETVAAMQRMTQRFRLGQLDGSFVPVVLEDIERAIANGKTGEELLSKWTGSQGFLVLDWAPTDETLITISQEEHRQLSNRSAKVLQALIAAKAEQQAELNPGAKLDVLFVSHGAGYDVNRKTVKRLSESDAAEDLDFVKVTAIDPYTKNELSGYWIHPGMTPILDQVDSFYVTTDIEGGGFIGEGTPDLFNLGPLDGKEGGAVAGFLNRQGWLLDLRTEEQIMRYRHWDPNEVRLSSAEMTDVEYNATGSLIATSGKDGVITVRYAKDVPDPADPNGPPLHARGDVKFHVRGHESLVRSLAFYETTVNGERFELLLSISDSRQEGDSSIDRNKVLVTNAATGQPVWQGRDINGTQVEASPSGRVLVSTDSNGNAKVWVRAEDSLQYERLAEPFAAHSGEYISDVVVLNDRYFVTAGLNQRVKLWRIDGDQVVEAQRRLLFDNPDEGAVRNLAYDPYTGLLAVGAGRSLSLWRFDQQEGVLLPALGDAPTALDRFSRTDHIDAIQGVSFSVPSLVLGPDGEFFGDDILRDGQGRAVTDADGEVRVPRTADGDIDQAALADLAAEHELGSVYTGLKLATGGEDKTVFLYTLDGFASGELGEAAAPSGAMLPVRELSLSPDGWTVAIVGGDIAGGPVRDIDITAAAESRNNSFINNVILAGRQPHNSAPSVYNEEIVSINGESFFWRRNSENALRAGDVEINPSLPPNKRNNLAGIDVAPIDLAIRPGDRVEVKPLQYLLEANRQEFTIETALPDWAPVVDVNDTDQVIGQIKNKVTDGETRPNIFVFEAAADLSFTESQTEFVGQFEWAFAGPDDDQLTEPREPAVMTFRVYNNLPIAYRDVVIAAPGETKRDVRPRANDYDFDNDDFSMVPAPQAETPIWFGDEVVAYYSRGANSFGVDVRVAVTEQRLAELLGEGETALVTSFTYEIEEDDSGLRSQGEVELRIQMPQAPTGVRFDKIGADQAVVHWNPVDWDAERYVLERFDEDLGQWVKHTDNSHVDGRQSDHMTIKNLEPNKQYWLRIVAVDSDTTPWTRFPSDPFAPRESGKLLKTPDFAAPTNVSAEALGPARIEVEFKPVYWQAVSYLVELRTLELDTLGQPQLLDAETGELKYDAVKSIRIEAGEQPYAVFNQLEPGTAYQAVVVARNGNEDDRRTGVDPQPVYTAERLTVAGVNVVRIGPKRAIVEWVAVPGAEGYRVVAVDPSGPLNSGRITQFFDKNTTKGEITGLNPYREPEQTEGDRPYLFFVEVRDKNGNWSSILDADEMPVDLTSPTAPAGTPEIAVLSGTEPSYLLRAQTPAGRTIQLPSLEGQLVRETRFSLVNLSQQDVTLVAAAGDTIAMGAEADQPQVTLSPTWPDTDGLRGPVVYRFYAERFVDENGERLVWQAEIADSLSEAHLAQTPLYLASEAGSLRINPEVDLLPRQLPLTWTTPLWNATSHRVEIREVIGGVTQPQMADSAKTITLANTTGKEREVLFRGLTPDTLYEIKLITKGGPGEFTETVQLRTSPLTAPRRVEVANVTRNSLEVTWDDAGWNVGNYRVVVMQQGPDGQFNVTPPGYTPRLLGPGARAETITGLQESTRYLIWVDALPAATDLSPEWVINENPEQAATAGFTLPEGAFLRRRDPSPTGFTVDWSEAETRLTPDGFAFHPDSYELVIETAGGQPAAGFETAENERGQIVVTGLSRGESYRVELRFEAAGKPAVSLGAAEGELMATAPATGVTKIEHAADAPSSHRIAIKWTPQTGGDATGFTIEAREANGDGEWRRVADYRNQGFVNGTNLGAGAREFEVAALRNDAGDWKRLAAGQSYEIRVLSLHADDAVLDGVTATFTTAAYAPPRAFEATGRNASSISVTWQAPEDGEPPEGYQLRYTTDDLSVVDPTEATWSNPEPISKADTSATITGLSPGQSYWVQLLAVYRKDSSPVGFQAASAELGPVQTDQGEVTGLSVTPRRLGVDVRWNAATWADSVVVSWSGGGRTGSKSFGPNATHWDVTNLQAGVAYAFTVAATKGGATATANASTSTKPFVEPKNVSAEAIGPRELRVDWDHTDDFKAPTEFKILLDGVVTATVGSSVRSKDIGNLKVATTYSVVVRAVYDADPSVDSTAVNGTTGEGAVTGLTTTAVKRTKMTVAWDSVGDWANWTKVQWRKVGASSWNGSGELASGRVQYEISGLNHETAYEVRVSAAGGGRQSEQVRVFPTGGFTTPSTPTLASRTGTSVTVNWTHSDPIGPAESFVVRTTDPFGNQLPNVTRGANARSATVDGLTPGVNYTFTIRAKYGLGDEDGPGRVISTLSLAPPSSVTESDIRQQRFTISWSFDDQDSDVKEFRIVRDTGKLLAVAGPDARSIEVRDRDTSRVTVNIKKNTEYKVRVEVVLDNAASTKLVSAWITVRTLG
ncbi:MAG: fibronectin type III domain-containing protein [Planctomycetota bacterium]